MMKQLFFLFLVIPIYGFHYTKFDDERAKLITECRKIKADAIVDYHLIRHPEIAIENAITDYVVKIVTAEVKAITQEEIKKIFNELK